MTGIIYIFMEVIFTSIFTDEMIKRFQYRESTGIETETLIKKASFTGFSSSWMLLIGGLSGISLFGIYKLINKRFIFFCLTSWGCYN